MEFAVAVTQDEGMASCPQTLGHEAARGFVWAAYFQQS
jgi:hypothetical protein